MNRLAHDERGERKGPTEFGFCPDKNAMRGGGGEHTFAVVAHDYALYQNAGVVRQLRE